MKNKLSKIFDEETDLDKATEKFLKRFDNILHQCFKKVSLKKDKPQAKQEKIYDLWKHLKKKTDTQSKAQLEKIEVELAEKYF